MKQYLIWEQWIGVYPVQVVGTYDNINEAVASLIGWKRAYINHTDGTHIFWLEEIILL